jgi:hypothetical protein
LYWAGERFEDLHLVGAEGDGRWARFLYSRCKTPGETGDCQVTLTIEASPAEDVRPADWDAVRAGIVRCTRERIRGADAALLPSTGQIFVFTGSTTVGLQGVDPRGRLRRAADALRTFGGDGALGELPPPSDELGDELRRVCRS